MELDVFLEKLKNNFPDKAIDISESLELIKETINDTIETVGNKINESITNRDFESVRHFSELAEEGHKYEVKIDEIIKQLEVEQEIIHSEEDENIETRIIPNYNEYLVDNNIEHSLYENFTHIRPYGFKMQNGQIIEVKTWQELLIKTCQICMEKDLNKFVNFQNDKKMNGKKNKYFSVNESDMRKPEFLGNGMYVETNMSGNGIRNLILKMIKEYGMKINDYKVYFRADYTQISGNIE